MSEIIVYNFLDGKNICNIFAKLIVNEINNITPESKVNIQVVNVRTFFVVRGVSSSGTVLNLSEIFQKFLKKYDEDLSKKIRVSVSTISRWLNTLQMFYYCFEIKPWSHNVKRTLVKEPKIYLYDWSLIQDIGAKFENFIDLHLYKFVMFQNDTGRGEYGLYFVRDKDKKEVDFLVVKDGKPWMLVEVKASSNTSISKSLYYYAQELSVPHAFQVVFDMEYVNKDCFQFKEPIIVPAQTLLSQLI